MKIVLLTELSLQKVLCTPKCLVKRLFTQLRYYKIHMIQNKKSVDIEKYVFVKQLLILISE